MKTSEIVKGLSQIVKDMMRNNQDGCLGTERIIIQEAIKFIHPWAELETGFGGIKGKLQGMAPEVNVEIALTVDIDKQVKEDPLVETILTDIDKRIAQLEDIDNFKGILASEDEKHRIECMNDAIDDLQSYYEAKKEAIQVEAS